MHPGCIFYSLCTLHPRLERGVHPEVLLRSCHPLQTGAFVCSVSAICFIKTAVRTQFAHSSEVYSICLAQVARKTVLNLQTRQNGTSLSNPPYPWSFSSKFRNFPTHQNGTQFAHKNSTQFAHKNGTQFAYLICPPKCSPLNPRLGNLTQDYQNLPKFTLSGQIEYRFQERYWICPLVGRHSAYVNYS